MCLEELWPGAPYPDLVREIIRRGLGTNQKTPNYSSQKMFFFLSSFFADCVAIGRA